MYLEHFKLKELPFSLATNTQFFCELSGHHTALNVLLCSLRSNEGFIKITGEVGSGKTLLCRLLLEKLGDEFVTAYIHTPDLEPMALRKALATELGVSVSDDHYDLLSRITEKLIALHASGKRVVLLIDEAQALPSDSLEALRLLTNLETKTTKLLQVVLFGQPELNRKLDSPTLRQLKQRISFAYHIPLLVPTEVKIYLEHRLTISGHAGGNLFTPRACRLLAKKSRGIPRLINIVAHKAMMSAFGCGTAQVSHRDVKAAVRDTESIRKGCLVRFF